VQQKLRHFEFINGHLTQTAAPASDASSPASPTAAVPANPPAEDHTVNELREISVVSLVIADLDPRGRKLTVDAMRQFVSTEMRPTPMSVCSR